MSEAVAVQIDELKRNQTSLWLKHDECEEERKDQAVKVERLEGRANVLSTKIDSILESTAKTEAIVLKMSESNAQAKGMVIGFKELLGIIAVLASIAGAYFGLS